MTTIVKNIVQHLPYVDIQKIPSPDKDKIFDILRKVEFIQGNDAATKMSFEDYFYMKDGQRIFNTEDYYAEYFDLFQLLSKYVPEEILLKTFIFDVWW